MAGGLLEYLSMVSGFRNLLVLAAAFYILALILQPRIAAALEHAEEDAEVDLNAPLETNREEMLEPVGAR